MSASEHLEERLGQLYLECSPEERDILAAMLYLAAGATEPAAESDVEGFSATALEGGGGVGKVAITPIPIPGAFEPGGGLGHVLPHRATAAALSSRLVARVR